MSNYMKSSNSSGKCLFCNTFFRRLATHMLSSETCMLASQASLSRKRMCCNDAIDKVSVDKDKTSDETGTFLKKPHLQTKQDRILQQSNTCEDDLCSTTSLHSSSDHNSMDDCLNIECNNDDTVSSQDDSSSVSSIGSVNMFPCDGGLFQCAFTPEEHFMINLCNTCVDANVPLDLVDKIVSIFRDAQSNGLNIDSNIIRSREYFLKHLNKRFVVPLPEIVKVTIEDPSGNDVVIDVIRHNFLLQALDLIHDHEIWGNENNFIGTIDMANPFDPTTYGRDDGKVDEVVDGVWYKKTVSECAEIANGERFLVLGLICYCDKTGTDVYQRNSLEPFSFTFCVFNRACRYKTAAWRSLGQIPDFDNLSSASHCVSRGGYIGKSRSTRNFHTCLEAIMDPLIGDQGKKAYICQRSYRG